MLSFLLLVTFTTAAWAQCPDDDPGLLAYSDPNTWPNQEIPHENAVLYLDFPLLLDTQTERLGGIYIQDGGKLVFKDDVNTRVELTTSFILIQDGGEMWIGADSDECRYRAEADILLTGERDGSLNIGDWGQKFIGVDAGGSLHIYGDMASPGKITWTKLSTTLTPKQKLFLSWEHDTETSTQQGFLIYAFDSNGVLYKDVGAVKYAAEMEAALADIVTGDGVVIIGKKKGIFNNAFAEFDLTQAAIESALGMEVDSLHLKDVSNKKDAYIMAVSLSDTSNFLESYDDWTADEGAMTDMITLLADNNIYHTYASTSPSGGGGVRTEVFIEAYASDYYNHELKLQADVAGSWKVGDELVIASTDYNTNQAERFEIVEVNGDTVTVEGELFYEHYADVYEGVEMCAEVGLLTRNIKIHGEMNETCYGDLCTTQNLDFDYFGGHTKTVHGFVAYTIQGAELYNMGQIGLGTYPIHYHLAQETERNGKKTAVKANAIHDTFNRCVTIHGSHDLEVQDNVAFNNMGHCFFLEDGGEKRTAFIHNLGISTMRGYVIPSDDQPTTFWITSPLTIMKDNSAAGSDWNMGTGIWYLFPDEPVGPSRELGFFGYREAKYTPILEFTNNVAHSNGNIGLAFFRRLDDDHDITDCSTYTPLVDPLDVTSKFQPIVMDSFTGFKNRARNVVMRAASADLINFKVSDSQVGIRLARNMLGGYQRLIDAIVIAESPNMGVGSSLKKKVGDSVIPLGWSDRSVPYPAFADRTVIGVEIKAEGPSHLENVKFVDFFRNEHREATAIGWQDAYIFHNGARTDAQGIEFINWSDPEDAYAMMEFGLIDGRGDSSISMRDLDGSLTGEAGSIVTQIGVYYADGADCTERQGWNLQVCKDAYFAKMYMWPNVKDEDITTFMTYHDYAADPTGNTYEYYAGAQPLNMRISYALPAAATGTTGFYLLNWHGEMEDSFGFRMSALEQGEQLVLGYCLPRGANETDITRLVRLANFETMIEASNLDELMTGSSDANVFFDRQTSIIYRRFYQEAARDPAVDLSDCIGDITELNGCQFFQVRLVTVRTGVDWFDGDCTNIFSDNQRS